MVTQDTNQFVFDSNTCSCSFMYHSVKLIVNCCCTFNYCCWPQITISEYTRRQSVEHFQYCAELYQAISPIDLLISWIAHVELNYAKSSLSYMWIMWLCYDSKLNYLQWVYLNPTKLAILKQNINKHKWKVLSWRWSYGITQQEINTYMKCII